jgi:hypothetical protein
LIPEFIPYDSLTLGAVLGEGEFGSVFKGTYQNPDGTTVTVHHILFKHSSLFVCSEDNGAEPSRVDVDVDVTETIHVKQIAGSNTRGIPVVMKCNT